MSSLLGSTKRNTGDAGYIWLSFVSFVVLFIENIFDEKLPVSVRYFDEVLAIFCLLGILLYLVGKHGKMPRNVGQIAIIMIALALEGLVGNMFSNLQPWRVVFLDAFLFFKPYFVLIFFLLTMTTDRAKAILKHAVKFSKLGLLFLASCGFLSLVADLGMMKNGAFSMYSLFYGSVSVWAILFYAVIFCNKEKKTFIYFCLMAFVVILTKSGLGIAMIGIIALIHLFFFRYKFHWYYVPIVGAIALFIGAPVLEEYFFTSNTPRYLLFYFSFVTMGACAPFGSGFATYGSAMAAREYSPLYYQYGFEDRYMMSPEDTRALQDSFYPIVFAQFGIFGTILYIIFIYLLLRKFIFRMTNKYSINSALIVISLMLIACIGFQTLNLWGCAMFFLIAVFFKSSEEI